MRLENDLLKSYYSHPRSTKHLRNQAYTKKNKNYSIFRSLSYDSQISSNESSSNDKFSHFHDKKVHFLTTNSRKGKYNLISLTRNLKKSTFPVTVAISPVRENICPVMEQRKFPVRELYLSLVRVASKAGKKHQDESNDQEDKKDKAK